MANHVYNGVPIMENGVVKYVQPIRAIQHTDGKYYHGVVDVDQWGNEFAYNRVPDTTELLPPRPQVSRFLAKNNDTDSI